jgi:hypothetical protein
MLNTTGCPVLKLKYTERSLSFSFTSIINVSNIVAKGHKTGSSG